MLLIYLNPEILWHEETQHSAVHIPWGRMFFSAERIGMWILENKMT
jgi:hypothetical protein